MEAARRLRLQCALDGGPGELWIDLGVGCSDAAQETVRGLIFADERGAVRAVRQMSARSGRQLV
jgi:hypothetical protein